jgi:hypothetical protein
VTERIADIDWTALDAALERRPPTLWWRDDDAVADSDALRRLMDLADVLGAPLTLAAIPAHLTPSLAPAITGRNVTIAVHGWSHENHAPAGEKNAEFGAHRPLAAMLDEAARGKAVIDDAFAEQALALFIPPWNRFDATLPLADLGYEGISVYGEREVSRDHGLTRLDAHLDPIDWRGTRSAISPQSFVDQTADLMASPAPIGLMTHHLVHDEAIWALVEAVTGRLTAGGAAWISARDLRPSRIA